MGSAADRRGLPPEMRGVRASDYDSAGEGGEECEGYFASVNAKEQEHRICGAPVLLFLKTVSFVSNFLWLNFLGLVNHQCECFLF